VDLSSVRPRELSSTVNWQPFGCISEASAIRTFVCPWWGAGHVIPTTTWPSGMGTRHVRTSDTL